MNRLTKRHNTGVSWNGNPDHSTQVRYRELLDRLAEYEDTGLTPEEAAELAKAKADGRLTELPCKVGDTVWAEAAIGPFGNPLMPYEVKEIAFECSGDFGDATCWFTFDKADLGKTVFLTRAEAEAALRKEQEQ